MSVVEDIKARLGDRWWRLNHLYKIENEKGSWCRLCFDRLNSVY